MTANRNLLRVKYAKVIEGYARSTGVTFDEALKRFYDSPVYEMMRDGISDMHCMSVPYLVEEVKEMIKSARA